MYKKPLFWVFVFLILYNGVVLAIIHFANIQPEAYSIHTNSIIQHWMKNGIINDKFIPIVSNSNQFYLSHPPFSYYFLFLFQKSLGFKSYYVLNSILVSISGFFIYLTIALLSLKRAKVDFSHYAWAGMLIYLFSYPVLRFQFFNYHPDIFILTSLIICQYLFLKMMMKERYRSMKYMFWISLILIIINYSSWFGVVFNFILSLIILFNFRKGYKLFPYILIAILISIMSVLVTFTQYAVVGGWSDVIHYFKDTYWRESPFSGHLRQTSFQILFQILKNIGILLFALIGLITASFFAKKRKFLFTKNGYKYLIISVFPVLIYSVVFIQYFQNNFACLYFIPPVIVSICIWMEKLYRLEISKFKIVKIVSLIVLSNLSLFFLQ